MKWPGWEKDPGEWFLSPCLWPWASGPLSKEGFLWDPDPPCQVFPPSPGGDFSPHPPPLPSPLEWLTGQGLCPKPAAGAGDTPSPSQGAWASGATPKIAQLSGPQIRLQPPCPDGAPGRAGSASPFTASTCSPVTRQRLSLDLNHSLPLEDTALLEAAAMGAMARGCLTVRHREEMQRCFPETGMI